MKDVNKVILVGRLGADPVLRSTQNGGSFSHFPVATSRKWKVADETEGEKLNEETQWHNIVAWGRQGENCAQFLKKGQRVYVEGMIRSRKYEDKEGQPKTSFEVHADSVSFLDGKRSIAKVEGTGTLMN